MHSPARTQKQYEQMIDTYKLCGANRGPHQYIPIKWNITKDTKEVTHLMCTVCFYRIAMETITQHF